MELAVTMAELMVIQDTLVASLIFDDGNGYFRYTKESRAGVANSLLEEFKKCNIVLEIKKEKP